MPLRSTGLSRPTSWACCALVYSDEAIGSAVKVRFLNAAARTSSLSGLPLSAAIWALAAGCASALSVLM